MLDWLVFFEWGWGPLVYVYEVLLYAYASSATLHRPCLFLFGRLLHTSLLLAYMPFLFMNIRLVTVRDARRWAWSHALCIEWCCRVVYSTVGTLYSCNDISLMLDYIWRIHSSLWNMWPCMWICIVPTCCSCHNSDCQGTYARLCFMVDALFVGQLVHTHSSHGHMCCYITWDASLRYTYG